MENFQGGSKDQNQKQNNNQVEIPKAEIAELASSVIAAVPQIEWTPSMEKALQKDIETILKQLLLQSPEALTNHKDFGSQIANTLKAILVTTPKGLLTHKTPEAKSLSSKHIKESLDSHTLIGRIMALVSTGVSVDVAAAVLEGFGGSVSPVFAGGFGFVVYSTLQYWKEKTMDQGEYSAAEIKQKLHNSKVEQALSRKRQLIPVLIGAAIGIISTFNTAVRLPEGDKFALERFEMQRTHSTLEQASSSDNQISEQLSVVIKQRSQLLNKVEYDRKKLSPTEQERIARLDKQIQTLSNQVAVFKHLPEQLTAEDTDQRAEFLMKSKDTTASDKPDFYFAYNHNVKGGREGSGYDLATRKVKSNVESFGGKYVEGGVPITPSQLELAKFEKLYKASDPENTILEYAKTQGPQKEQEAIEQIKDIKSGKYFNSQKAGPKLSIGINRFLNTIFIDHTVPDTVVAALLVLLLECIPIVNTGRFLFDKQFQHLYWNEDLQKVAGSFTKALNSALTKALTDRGYLDIDPAADKDTNLAVISNHIKYTTINGQEDKKKNVKNNGNSNDGTTKTKAFSSSFLTSYTRDLCLYGTIDSARMVAKTALDSQIGEREAELTDITDRQTEAKEGMERLILSKDLGVVAKAQRVLDYKLQSESVDETMEAEVAIEGIKVKHIISGTEVENKKTEAIRQQTIAKQKAFEAELEQKRQELLNIEQTRLNDDKIRKAKKRLEEENK